MQGITGMTKKDAQASYKDFKKEAGGEKIKLDKFTKLVNSMNTNKGNKMVQFLVKRLPGIQVIIRHRIYDLKQAWATPGPRIFL